MDDLPYERIRALLCRLGDAIRDAVIAARDRHSTAELSTVDAITAADTIYRIDRISEDVIATWFARHWPASLPIEVVMEGSDGCTFPMGTPVGQTHWKCILDPIDGTRCIMYDKRSAWMLAGVAPQKGADTRLSGIVVAAMTELPVSKAWRADQVSAVRGCGDEGIMAEAVDVRSGARTPLRIHPSTADDFENGFAGISLFFPEGKGITAEIEEALWGRLFELGSTASPKVFADQYVSTGGQLFELLVGHDRMNGDLRPLVFAQTGTALALTCHPYDVCTALILQEAGGVVEAPDGSPLDAPLDTTSPVAWMGYANRKLAGQVRPVMREILRERGLL